MLLLQSIFEFPIVFLEESEDASPGCILYAVLGVLGAVLNLLLYSVPKSRIDGYIR
jgi:hypothetical protein